jgi:hypothetical protein
VEGREGQRRKNPVSLLKAGFFISGLMKNTHLRRSPHSSSLRRTSMYDSFLRISGALHLDIFAQPEMGMFYINLLRQP